MNVAINTKFDVGDVVYVAEHYYEFYAPHKTSVVSEVLVDVNSRRTSIRYEFKQDGYTYRAPEGWVFKTYEECEKWCRELNCK